MMKIVNLKEEPNISWIKQIAQIHHQELEVGFLSKMGPGFLEKLYTHAIKRDDAVVLSAIKDNTVCGFICGLQNREEFIKNFIIKNWNCLFFWMLEHLFSIHLWARLFKVIINYRSNNSGNLPRAELFSFAVDKTNQKNGVGFSLFSALKEYFNKNSITQFKIIASTTQPEAIAFYNKRGAKIIDTTQIGPLNCYVFIYEQ